MDVGKIASLMGKAKGNIEKASCSVVEFRLKDGTIERIRNPIVVRIKMGTEVTYTVTPGDSGIEPVIADGTL